MLAAGRSAVKVRLGVGVRVGEGVFVGIMEDVGDGVVVSLGSGIMIARDNSGPKSAPFPVLMRQDAECKPGAVGATISTIKFAFDPALVSGCVCCEAASSKVPLAWSS